MMKKNFLLFFSMILAFVVSSCSDDVAKSYYVNVTLEAPTGSSPTLSDITVELKDATGKTYQTATNATGTASFIVPAGIYEASTSFKQSVEGVTHAYNAITSGIIVSEGSTETFDVTLSLTESTTGQLVIKEIYIGGCATNDGSSSWTKDKYVTIYNNSAEPATVTNLCIGIVYPANAHASGDDYDSNGQLYYANEDFIPVGGAGYWYFPGQLTIEPYTDLTVAMFQAINHTLTYSNSVDLSGSNIYAMYDIQDFNNANYYASPSANISTSHYLNSVKYGLGNAWVIGDFSPAMVLFTLTDPESYGTDVNNYYYYGGPNNANKDSARCVKIPRSSVLDGVEVFYEPSKDTSKKRITPDIDGGYSLLTNKLGRTTYRNVDKDATEALEENAGKLVYGYSLGNDPSGIDAEASIKNGAHIIYQDSNNSTKDFHQRSSQALKN